MVMVSNLSLSNTLTLLTLSIQKGMVQA